MFSMAPLGELELRLSSDSWLAELRASAASRRAARISPQPQVRAAGHARRALRGGRRRCGPRARRVPDASSWSPQGLPVRQLVAIRVAVPLPDAAERVSAVGEGGLRFGVQAVETAFADLGPSRATSISFGVYESLFHGQTNSKTRVVAKGVAASGSAASPRSISLKQATSGRRPVVEHRRPATVVRAR